MPRDPLFPHVPKRREPMFPHVPGAQVTPEVTLDLAKVDESEKFFKANERAMKGWGGVRQVVYDREKGITPADVGKIPISKREAPPRDWNLPPEDMVSYLRRTGMTKAQAIEKVTKDYLPALQKQVAIPKAEGELLPPQYRGLVGLISEPLLPAIEPEEGERKIDAVLKQLKVGVEGIQESYQFRLFLTTMSKFHDYSIGNQILIMLQEPNATHVAGYVTWKELGRWVKRGGKSISILAPRFPPRPTCPKCGAKLPKGAGFCPKCGVSIEEMEIGVAPAYFVVVSVFDISQTEGKPLPEFEVPVLTGAVNEELFSKLLVLMKAKGIPVSFESRPHLDPAIKGQYSPVTGIWVRPEEPRAQQLKSLSHEIAHHYSEGVFHIPRYDAETIAESAAFVVGAHYGFDTGVRSFPYVALWARDKKVLEKNLGDIRKVVTTILEALD